MERFLIVVVVITVVILISIALRAYQDVAEPFVLTASRKPRTNNTTGRYTDEQGQGAGFFHCKRDDDTSEENASLPTCTEMRRGMIQKARDDGQIPVIPPVVRAKYPPTDENEVIGSVGSLQVILNRTAHKSRHQLCVPFVDCERYVNPDTKSLYCPVGMTHITDGKGAIVGCNSFPENQLLASEITATNGSRRVMASILRNIQTIGPGFKLYPPKSIIQSSLDVQTRQEKEPVNTADKVVNEKANVVLNMIRSYPNLLSQAEKAMESGIGTSVNTNNPQTEILTQYFDGVMESYVLYQPLSNGTARVGFMRVAGLTPTIGDLRAFDGEGPNYEVLANDFIPDTMSPPDGLMPIITPHKQTNYGLPIPSQPFQRLFV
jgi:hypothetical protein